MDTVKLFDKLTILPALVKEKGGVEADARLAGFSVTDTVEKKYGDTYVVRRTYKNESTENNLRMPRVRSDKYKVARQMP